MSSNSRESALKLTLNMGISQHTMRCYCCFLCSCCCSSRTMYNITWQHFIFRTNDSHKIPTQYFGEPCVIDFTIAIVVSEQIQQENTAKDLRILRFVFFTLSAVLFMPIGQSFHFAICQCNWTCFFSRTRWSKSKVRHLVLDSTLYFCTQSSLKTARNILTTWIDQNVEILEISFPN